MFAPGGGGAAAVAAACVETRNLIIGRRPLFEVEFSFLFFFCF
jgi:hypothetical protein